MFIKIVTLYFVFFFSTFAHELGHIVMAKIFYNVKNSRIEIGKGKNILKLKKIIVNALPVYGHAYWELEDFDSYKKSSKLRKIMPSLGGPLVSLLIALGFILISGNNYGDFYNQIIKYFIMYNSICFISTVLPIKYINYSSDGMRILNTIKSTEDNVN
ncbi:MAG: M50 family metallopeptidase [Finegoldia magna]|uniref:Peptidase M50 n=1 Tax=Finegoldia magna TaxID=1260 RepID=A0A233V7U8_FINMA|nr:M50 family metallopeptidase [Finegoldia magna]MDU5223414.1 M50 family metallopeptidase [Finegoldia magna]MDU5236745.1 M50 family metallopeptidase [Finegoldia magna]OXZ28462.1 peptidase M50 [Finegoldia magna]